MSKLMYSVELKMEVPHTSSLDGKKKKIKELLLLSQMQVQLHDDRTGRLPVSLFR